MTKQLFYIFHFLFLFGASSNLFSQKVGIVLSGGGANGLAHIGFLKALEENQIPIDYITGTSIGAWIGGLYSAGYSPKEIEKIFCSKEFENIYSDQLNGETSYLFKNKDEDGSWFEYKLNLDTTFINNIPTNFINSTPFDFELMKMFLAASSKKDDNFDSLLVPFRCVASDINNHNSIAFKNGNLSSAIRASMAYPLYLRPLDLDGKLLFDGGLYDNFPAELMNKTFRPDIIIGCSVTKNIDKANDENIYLQIRNMMTTPSDFNLNEKNGIIISPNINRSILYFENAKEAIDSGYYSCLRKIDSIKNLISRSTDLQLLNERRNKYKTETVDPVFDKIEIEGVNNKESSFIINSLLRGDKQIRLNKLKKRFLMIAQDNRIRYIFPIAKLNVETGNFILKLIVKKDKDYIVKIGGNFSNRPISGGFLSIQRNYLGKFGGSFEGNTYFGKFHTSGMLKSRLDFAKKIPFYTELIGCYSFWDYFRSSNLFYNLEVPPYLQQRDIFGEINFGLPAGKHSTLEFGGGVSELTNIYYQVKNFKLEDTADRTFFDFSHLNVNYVLNNLDKKQFPSSGKMLAIKAKVINGFEYSYPGSTAAIKDTVSNFHQWFQIKAITEMYFKTIKQVKLGIYGEAAFSSQGFFDNYVSSMLNAPAFTPTPESRTLFLNNYRAHKYLASGFKMIIEPVKNLQLRGEIYLFQPFNSILENQNRKAYYSADLLYRHFLGMGSVVYQTPIGPLSFSINYYEAGKESFTFLFQFGYAIFNKRSID